MNNSETSFKVVFGRYASNAIVTEGGERIICFTYRSLREKIEGKEGYFHLRMNDNLGDWVLFQALIDDILFVHT